MEFICGTPLLRELDRAINDFHEGIPVGDRIAIDEVVISACISGVNRYDWSMSELENGKSIKRVNHIYGFNPEPGYYRLKARRYTIIPVPEFQAYELIEILEKI